MIERNSQLIQFDGLKEAVIANYLRTRQPYLKPRLKAQDGKANAILKQFGGETNGTMENHTARDLEAGTGRRQHTGSAESETASDGEHGSPLLDRHGEGDPQGLGFDNTRRQDAICGTKPNLQDNIQGAGEEQEGPAVEYLQGGGIGPNAGEAAVLKRKTQREMILGLLKAEPWVSSLQLSNISLQYNARLYELRHGLHNGIRYNIASIEQLGNNGYILMEE